jgi:hypothetical protein
MINTISGKLLGKGNDIVVRYDDIEKSRASCSCRGRWAYVKKCKKPEELGGVSLCEKSRNDTPLVMILAVGEGCGKFHKLTKEEKKLGMTSQVEWPEDAVGLQALCPDNHPWGIMDSPWDRNEYFVHECIIKAILG